MVSMRREALEKTLILMASGFFLAACATEAPIRADVPEASITAEIINGRDSPINMFFGSNVENSDWGDDLLEAREFPAGWRMTLLFSETLSCVYDFRAEFDDDKTVKEWDVDICEIPQLTIE